MRLDLVIFFFGLYDLKDLLTYRILTNSRKMYEGMNLDGRCAMNSTNISWRFFPYTFMSQRNEPLAAGSVDTEIAPPGFLVLRYTHSCNTMSEFILDCHVSPDPGHPGRNW